MASSRCEPGWLIAQSARQLSYFCGWCPPACCLMIQVVNRTRCHAQSEPAFPLEELDDAMKSGRVLLADSHLNVLGGVHSLLEGLFDTVIMVADERSLVDAVTAFRPDL